MILELILDLTLFHANKKSYVSKVVSSGALEFASPILHWH